MPQDSNNQITNQQATTIINVATSSGGINVQNATIQMNGPVDAKPISRKLTRKLIEAIKDYSPKANIFLGKIPESEKANWEMRIDNRHLPDARGTILSSYASVLGEFLAKLFGCENTRDYFDVSITLTKRALQLMNFTFISALQRYLKEGDNQLTEKTPVILSSFFETQHELYIYQYAELLSELITIFNNQQIEFPIQEIKARENEFKKGGSFFEACKKLHELTDAYGDSLPSVNEIENLLTDFLVELNFLAAYKMISIKDISYEEVWHKDDVRGKRYQNRPQYLHCYTLLGNTKNGARKYNYADKPLNTEAVLLFKKNYSEGISIFPFVIDYNNIIEEPEVNICFFNCYENEYDENTGDTRKIIRYAKFDKVNSGADNNDIIIRFDEDIENALASASNKDIITLFKTEDNSNKFKAKRRNEVFMAFEEVKTTVLGLEE